MKRLIKKSNSEENNEENIDNNIVNKSPQESNSETIQELRQDVMDEMRNKNQTNMVMLNQLDEASVRHDICPQCKYTPIVRKNGYKICPSCGMVYKMLNGTGYIVLE